MTTSIWKIIKNRLRRIQKFNREYMLMITGHFLSDNASIELHHYLVTHIIIITVIENDPDIIRLYYVRGQ